MWGMTQSDVLTRFDRATDAAHSVIAAVSPEQLAAQSPCTEWSVRDVLNHLIGGQEFLTHALTTGSFDRASFDRDRDFLTPDPATAFTTSAATLRTRITADGFLDTLAPTPFGPQPGAVLVEMRITEMLVHGWDVARATGQPTDLAPEVAEVALQGLARLRAKAPSGGPFGAAQPASPDAPAADRLAALAGRSLT